MLSAPSQRLVTVMNAIGRDLAVVIDQGVQQKKFKEATS
jgi:large subunit ribosomal protein L10